MPTFYMPDPAPYGRGYQVIRLETDPEGYVLSDEIVETGITTVDEARSRAEALSRETGHPVAYWTITADDGRERISGRAYDALLGKAEPMENQSEPSDFSLLNEQLARLGLA